MTNQPYSPDPRVPQASPHVASAREANVGGAYAESQRESYVDPAGNRVENRTDVVEDENLRRAHTRTTITRAIYFVLGALEVILGLRFLFRLLGANESSGFVAFLYNLSYLFVAPFQGIFNDQNPAGNNVFEISTLVAMLIYALIAWGLVSLVRVLLSSGSSSHKSMSVTRQRRSL